MMKYWQSHPGFLTVVVGLCLGSILPTDTFASTRSGGQVIGAGKIESCSWPEEQKPFFLQAVKRLARDNESAEIRLESAKESESRQRAEAERILKATTPEKLKALQRENIQYATHGIDDRVCQGSGASATWISVVVRRKPEDIARDRKRIDDETNQPNPVRDDVFQSGPDVGPTGDSDICAKSPDSFHCRFGNVQIDDRSKKVKPPPKTLPPVVQTPKPGFPHPPTVRPSPQQPKALPVQKTPESNFSPNPHDPPAFAYVKGLGRGFEDCAHGYGISVQVLWQATHAMMSGNFPDASKLLGVPAEVLKGIWDDFNQPIVLSTAGGQLTSEEVSLLAHQNGRTAAKRICEAIPVGKVAKCVGGILGKACGKIGKTVAKGTKNGLDKGKEIAEKLTKKTGEKGGKKGKDHIPDDDVPPDSTHSGDNASRGPPPGPSNNPLKGKAILDEVNHLANKKITVPGVGEIQVGDFVDDGHYGVVYKIPSQKGVPGEGWLLKVSKDLPNATEAMENQVKGSKILKSVGVPTPEIRDVHLGSPDEPSFLTIKDIHEYPGGKLFDAADGAYAQQRAAVKQMYDELGKKGLVAPDLHRKNIFFFQEKGKLKAGVIEADPIYKASELNNQTVRVRNQTAGYLMEVGKQNLVLGANPDGVKIMDAIFNKWYPNNPPTP